MSKGKHRQHGHHAGGAASAGSAAAKPKDAPTRPAGLAERAGAAAQANPLALVAGGLALGAVTGALLPRSAREKQLLAPVGERLGASVTAALAAAKDAGRAELEGAGISRDAAREQVRGLFDGLVRAASAAGSAAAQAAATAEKGRA